MNQRPSPHRKPKLRVAETLCLHRGLTLLELMLALVVVVLLAGAIAGMMGAVTTGVSTRRDSRTTMVSAHSAASRLAAYVAPSRCVLSDSPTSLVLWLHDSRNSNTVHATEVRWLLFDTTTGTFDVHFVRFPEEWAQPAKDLEDKELPANSDWLAVLGTYSAKGWTASMPLVDALDGVSITTDAPSNAPLDARHISFDLSFQTTNGTTSVVVPATIRLHEQPES